MNPPQGGTDPPYILDLTLDSSFLEQAQQIQLRPRQEVIEHKALFLPEGYQKIGEWVVFLVFTDNQKAEQKFNEMHGPLPPIGPPGQTPSGKVSQQEIAIVQNLIERCLQLYMNHEEVITALQLQANVDPNFTRLVWEKLELQNPNFFLAYNVRLRIKEQITAFNYLVSQQAQVLQKSGFFNTAPNTTATQRTFETNPFAFAPSPSTAYAQAAQSQGPSKRSREGEDLPATAPRPITQSATGLRFNFLDPEMSNTPPGTSPSPHDIGKSERVN